MREWYSIPNVPAIAKQIAEHAATATALKGPIYLAWDNIGKKYRSRQGLSKPPVELTIREIANRSKKSRNARNRLFLRRGDPGRVVVMIAARYIEIIHGTRF
jgi:hypothetical protein